jgi:hypothetical protein
MTQNLGLVKLVHVGATPPTNILMIWYDSNTGINIHKYYDTLSSTWLPLISATTLFYPTYGSLPVPGQTGFLYVVLAGGSIYIWDGTNYVVLGSNGIQTFIITDADFSGENYVNPALDSKVPDIGFFLFSDEGSGALLKVNDGYLFSGTTITASAGNYRLIIF